MNSMDKFNLRKQVLLIVFNIWIFLLVYYFAVNDYEWTSFFGILNSVILYSFITILDRIEEKRYSAIAIFIEMLIKSSLLALLMISLNIFTLIGMLILVISITLLGNRFSNKLNNYEVKFDRIKKDAYVGLTRNIMLLFMIINVFLNFKFGALLTIPILALNILKLKYLHYMFRFLIVSILQLMAILSAWLVVCDSTNDGAQVYYNVNIHELWLILIVVIGIIIFDRKTKKKQIY